MPNSNAQVAKSILTNTFATNGLLPPEVARQFLEETYDKTALRQQIRHEIREAKKGTIEKIGINSRILRAKLENTDDGYRAGVHTSGLPYDCVDVRLPFEISQDTLRQNIEKEKLEQRITGMMTGQFGRDLEDLSINGDEDIDSSDPDYNFLKLNNGFKKQIVEGGNVYNVSTINGGEMSIDTFYKGAMQLDSKYLDPKMRWIMSPRRKMEWDRVLNAQGIAAGGFASDRFYSSPASYAVIEVPRLDDNTILLTDPKNLIEVSTYSVSMKKDSESKEAIMKDMIYYVTHRDVDFIIEELAATLAITGLKSLGA